MIEGRRHVTRRSLSYWLWTGYWLVLFLATHVRVPPGAPTGFENSDKVLHFGAYFVLARLGTSAISARGRLSVVTLIGWAAVYLLYGAVDEWLQQYTGREASVADWLADAAGVMTATLWGVLRARCPRISEPASRGATGQGGTNVTRDSRAE